MVERCMVRPPSARVGPVSPEERADVIKKSPLKGKYDQMIDSDSAYEMLQRRTHDTAAPVPTGQPTGAAPGAPQGAPQASGGLLAQLGGMLGSVFGTGRPR